MTSSINWNDLSLSPELLSLIETAGYKNPSPVQAQSIPHVLNGHDVLVSSQTGSGKTASFVLPIVERFKEKNGTYILALAPTREIAQQTAGVFETFGNPFGMKTVVCIGGASIPQEKEALASSPHIIVATPGRLCDHLERGNVWLDFIQCLVFDEADRMLDMGFANQIEMITEQIPKERQTLMFSATFAPKVEKLAKKVMRDPKEVTIEKTETTKPQIDERLYWMEEDRKLSALARIMREEEGTIIVFVSQKEKVYRVWRALHSKGLLDVTYIHSDIAQEQREAAIADFKAGKFRVLVATDVMGRGIDVDDVAHVVNYDIPREAADYVHRIGRTGRRGKTGMASTFAIPGKDDRGIKAIALLKGTTPPEVPSRDDGPRREQGRGNDRNRGRSDNRGPRTERPRNVNHNPKGPEPRKRTPDTKPNPVQVNPQPITPISKKSGGFLGWFKKILSK